MFGDSTIADVAPRQHGHTVRRNQDVGEKERDWVRKMDNKERGWQMSETGAH